MITLYIVLVIVGFSLYFRRKKSMDRKILINEMTAIYEKMEISLLKNEAKINGDIASFLMSHKNLVVNPEYADIRIIMHYNNDKNKRQKPSKINEENIPEYLLELSNEFKSRFVGLVRLSMLNWRFIRVCLLCGTFLFLDYFLHFGGKFYRKASTTLESVITPNPYVASVITGRNQENLTEVLLPVSH